MGREEPGKRRTARDGGAASGKGPRRATGREEVTAGEAQTYRGEQRNETSMERRCGQWGGAGRTHILRMQRHDTLEGTYSHSLSG